VTTTFDPADETWRRAFARDDWPDLLAAAITSATAERRVAVPFQLHDIAIAAEPDGTYLDIRYRPTGGLLVGRRWCASDVPPAGAPDSATALDVARWVAEWVVLFELGEPLGSYVDRLVRDHDGTGWWGAGFPVP
jgi:hypothetical protein